MNQTNNELYHYGVKGMKWGVRRTNEQLGYKVQSHRKKEKEYREKMKKVSKNSQITAGEKSRAEYASKTVPGKVATVLKAVVVRKVLTDVLNGEIGKYTNMSKVDMIKEAKDIAKTTAITMAKMEASSRSTAMKFDNDGQRINGKNAPIIAREDMFDIGLRVAIPAYKVAGYVASKKYFEAKATRAANEAKFNKWAEEGRILEYKFDDIVEISSSDWRIIK